jgi:hypothetical protein
MLGNDGEVDVEAQSLKSEKARPKCGEVFLIYAAHGEVLLHTALSLSLHKISLSGVTQFCKLLTPEGFLFLARESQQPGEEGATSPTPSQLQQNLKISN